MGPAFRARWATLRLTHSRARVVDLLRRGSVGQITADWNLPVLREDLLLQSFRCRLGWSHAGVACMSVAAIGLTKMALHYDIAGQCHRTSSRTSPGNVIEQLPLRHRRAMSSNEFQVRILADSFDVSEEVAACIAIR